MEALKILFLGLILMSSCLAVENQTRYLEQQLKIQKREKPYLLEDDPCDESEQKREERQSVPDKTNQVEPKVQPKAVNVRLQPKMMPTSLKPALKPIVMQKPINLHMDTTPQKIPTKIPVILKTTKVVPNPAHAVRIKMLENMKNNSISNKELDFNANNENVRVTNKGDPLSEFKEDNIPFTIENKVDLKTDERESPNRENKVLLNQESKVTQNKYHESPVNLPKDDNKEDISIPATNEEVNLLDIKRRYHFFIDEAEPLPSINRDQTKPETKNKEVTQIKVNNKTKKDDLKQKDPSTADLINNGPEIIQILNGTHLISIKKIPDHDRHKIQQLLSRDSFDELEPQIEERIINKKPPKQSNELDKLQTKENIVLHGTQYSDSKIKDDKNKQDIEMKHSNTKENKDPKDCITIINHDYEEIEERTPILPAEPTNTYDDARSKTWNVPHTLQNFYYNPYHQNVYDQYRRYYDQTQIDPNVGQIESNNNLFTDNPEYSQTYYQNENQPIYNNPYDPHQPDVDTSCPEARPENTLDRIWRAWKDVEIKIRNSESNDEPINIDIRRNIADSSSKVSNNGVGKLPFPYVSQPNVLNGYYNNQNSASAMYPYVNHRYVR